MEMMLLILNNFSKAPFIKVDMMLIRSLFSNLSIYLGRFGKSCIILISKIKRPF